MKNAYNLKDFGLKATVPRLKILELFESGEAQHLSAEDVYRQLVSEGIDVGFATVYRVLTQFELAGVLQRQYFDSNKAIFEINRGEHHDHIVCLDCGAVEEFNDEEIERLQVNAARRRQFELSDHSLCLYAHCRKQNCIHLTSDAKQGAKKFEDSDEQT